MSIPEERTSKRPAIYPDRVIEPRSKGVFAGGSCGWTQADLNAFAGLTPAERSARFVEAAGGDVYIRWLQEFLGSRTGADGEINVEIPDTHE